MTKDILTFNEFIDYCGFSPSKGYKTVHENGIPYFKPNNGKLFFKLEDVKKYLLQNRQSSKSEIESQSLIHV